MFLHVCYNHSKRSYIFPSEPNVTTSNLYRCSDTKFYYPFSWNMHAIRIYREPGCPEVEQSRPCTGQDHSSFCTCNTKKSHSYIYVYIQCQTLSNPIPIDVNVENKHLRKQTSTKLLVEFLEEISRLEMDCLGSCRA